MRGSAVHLIAIWWRCGRNRLSTHRIPCSVYNIVGSFLDHAPGFTEVLVAVVDHRSRSTSVCGGNGYTRAQQKRAQNTCAHGVVPVPGGTASEEDGAAADGIDLW